jgi:hypothetical protein
MWGMEALAMAPLGAAIMLGIILVVGLAAMEAFLGATRRWRLETATASSV